MTWAGLIARRLARVVVVIVVVASLSWLLVEASPGSPGERAARAAGVLPADDSEVPAALRLEIVKHVEREHDLDGSWSRRLGGYLVGLAHLDMGRSWRDGQSVAARLAHAAAPTLVLLLASLVLAICVGLFAALASARRPGSAGDLILGAVTAVALATPPVWIAIAGLRTFATGEPWQWLPASGLDSTAAAILPVVTLALVPAFVIARHGRAALVEAARAPWAIAVHALRASLPTLLPLVVVLTAYLLGATVVIEQVFGIRGLGSVLVDASGRGDAPVVVGVSVIAGAVLALVSAIVDIVNRALDPRREA